MQGQSLALDQGGRSVSARLGAGQGSGRVRGGREVQLGGAVTTW